MEIISNIILSITLIVIIWYSWETRQMRKINQTQLSILLKDKEPVIIAYFDNGNTFYNIKFIIKNVGNGIAKNIKVTFDPQYDIGTKVFTDYFNKNALLSNGISLLVSNGEYHIRAGNTIGCSKIFKEIDDSGKYKIPHEYDVTVVYENQFGEKFNDTHHLSLNQFFDRINPDDKSEIEKQLKEINENLKNLKYAITDLKVDDDIDQLETDVGNDELRKDD